LLKLWRISDVAAMALPLDFVSPEAPPSRMAESPAKTLDLDKFVRLLHGIGFHV
jgi:hypothetical protein